KVHPIQIAKWRKAALEQLPELFVDWRTCNVCATEFKFPVPKTWVCGTPDVRPNIDEDQAKVLLLTSCYQEVAFAPLEEGAFPFRMLRAAEFNGPPSLSTAVIPLCSSA